MMSGGAIPFGPMLMLSPSPFHLHNRENKKLRLLVIMLGVAVTMLCGMVGHMERAAEGPL
jgi:hypothetical protein